METAEMGRVLVEAKVENLQDLWRARRGEFSDNEVRRVVIPDAFVDTGAIMLSLPQSVIAQLGLAKRYEKRIRTNLGVAAASVYDPVLLTIMGRDCTVDVFASPDSNVALIGPIVLTALGFVVEPKRQRLIGNPEHGGEHVIETY